MGGGGGTVWKIGSPPPTTSMDCWYFCLGPSLIIYMYMYISYMCVIIIGMGQEFLVLCMSPGPWRNGRPGDNLKVHLYQHLHEKFRDAMLHPCDPFPFLPLLVLQRFEMVHPCLHLHEFF